MIPCFTFSTPSTRSVVMPRLLAMPRRPLSVGAVTDQFEAFVIRHEQFIDADSPGVPEVTAFGAAAGAEELFDVAGGFLDLPSLIQRRLVRFLAGLAELSHQPLRQHAGRLLRRPDTARCRGCTGA